MPSRDVARTEGTSKKRLRRDVADSDAVIREGIEQEAGAIDGIPGAFEYDDVGNPPGSQQPLREPDAGAAEALAANTPGAMGFTCLQYEAEHGQNLSKGT